MKTLDILHEDPTQLLHDLVLANYIFNSPIFKQGHSTRRKGLGLPSACIETIVEGRTLSQLIILLLIFR